jgi:hypothetical protein
LDRLFLANDLRKGNEIHLNHTLRLIVLPSSPSNGTRSKVHGARLNIALHGLLLLAPCAIPVPARL